MVDIQNQLESKIYTNDLGLGVEAYTPAQLQSNYITSLDENSAVGATADVVSIQGAQTTITSQPSIFSALYQRVSDPSLGYILNDGVLNELQTFFVKLDTAFNAYLDATRGLGSAVNVVVDDFNAYTQEAFQTLEPNVALAKVLQKASALVSSTLSSLDTPYFSQICQMSSKAQENIKQINNNLANLLLTTTTEVVVSVPLLTGESTLFSTVTIDSALADCETQYQKQLLQQTGVSSETIPVWDVANETLVRQLLDRQVTVEGGPNVASAYNGQKDMNVQAFIQPAAPEVAQLLEKLYQEGSVTPDMSQQEKVLAINQYLTANFSYVSDSTSGAAWKEPSKTIADRGGDCEDLAILMESLCLAAGVESNRLQVYVDPGTKEVQGHVVCGFVTDEQKLVEIDVSQELATGNVRRTISDFTSLDTSGFEFSFDAHNIYSIDSKTGVNFGVFEDPSTRGSLYTAGINFGSQVALSGAFKVAEDGSNLKAFGDPYTASELFGAPVHYTYSGSSRLMATIYKIANDMSYAQWQMLCGSFAMLNQGMTIDDVTAVVNNLKDHSSNSLGGTNGTTKQNGETLGAIENSYVARLINKLIKGQDAGNLLQGLQDPATLQTTQGFQSGWSSNGWSDVQAILDARFPAVNGFSSGYTIDQTASPPIVHAYYKHTEHRDAWNDNHWTDSYYSRDYSLYDACNNLPATIRYSDSNCGIGCTDKDKSDSFGKATSNTLGSVVLSTLPNPTVFINQEIAKAGLEGIASFAGFVKNDQGIITNFNVSIDPNLQAWATSKQLKFMRENSDPAWVAGIIDTLKNNFSTLFGMSSEVVNTLIDNLKATNNPAELIDKLQNLIGDAPPSADQNVVNDDWAIFQTKWANDWANFNQGTQGWNAATSDWNTKQTAWNAAWSSSGWAAIEATLNTKYGTYGYTVNQETKKVTYSDQPVSYSYGSSGLTGESADPNITAATTAYVNAKYPAGLPLDATLNISPHNPTYDGTQFTYTGSYDITITHNVNLVDVPGISAATVNALPLLSSFISTQQASANSISGATITPICDSHGFPTDFLSNSVQKFIDAKVALQGLSGTVTANTSNGTVTSFNVVDAFILKEKQGREDVNNPLLSVTGANVLKVADSLGNISFKFLSADAFMQAELVKIRVGNNTTANMSPVKDRTGAITSYIVAEPNPVFTETPPTAAQNQIDSDWSNIKNVWNQAWSDYKGQFTGDWTIAQNAFNSALADFNSTTKGWPAVKAALDLLPDYESGNYAINQETKQVINYDPKTTKYDYAASNSSKIEGTLYRGTTDNYLVRGPNDTYSPAEQAYIDSMNIYPVNVDTGHRYLPKNVTVTVTQHNTPIAVAGTNPQEYIFDGQYDVRVQTDNSLATLQADFLAEWNASGWSAVKDSLYNVYCPNGYSEGYVYSINAESKTVSVNKTDGLYVDIGYNAQNDIIEPPNPDPNEGRAISEYSASHSIPSGCTVSVAGEATGHTEPDGLQYTGTYTVYISGTPTLEVACKDTAAKDIAAKVPSLTEFIQTELGNYNLTGASATAVAGAQGFVDHFDFSNLPSSTDTTTTFSNIGNVPASVKTLYQGTSDIYQSAAYTAYIASQNFPNNQIPAYGQIDVTPVVVATNEAKNIYSADYVVNSTIPVYTDLISTGVVGKTVNSHVITESDINNLQTSTQFIASQTALDPTYLDVIKDLNNHNLISSFGDILPAYTAQELTKTTFLGADITSSRVNGNAVFTFNNVDESFIKFEEENLAVNGHKFLVGSGTDISALTDASGVVGFQFNNLADFIRLEQSVNSSLFSGKDIAVNTNGAGGITGFTVTNNHINLSIGDQVAKKMTDDWIALTNKLPVAWTDLNNAWKTDWKTSCWSALETALNNKYKTAYTLQHGQSIGSSYVVDLETQTVTHNWTTLRKEEKKGWFGDVYQTDYYTDSHTETFTLEQACANVGIDKAMLPLNTNGSIKTISNFISSEQISSNKIEGATITKANVKTNGHGFVTDFLSQAVNQFITNKTSLLQGMETAIANVSGGIVNSTTPFKFSEVASVFRTNELSNISLANNIASGVANLVDVTPISTTLNGVTGFTAVIKPAIVQWARAVTTENYSVYNASMATIVKNDWTSYAAQWNGSSILADLTAKYYTGYTIDQDAKTVTHWNDSSPVSVDISDKGDLGEAAAYKAAVDEIRKSLGISADKQVELLSFSKIFTPASTDPVTPSSLTCSFSAIRITETNSFSSLGLSTAIQNLPRPADFVGNEMVKLKQQGWLASITPKKGANGMVTDFAVSLDSSTSSPGSWSSDFTGIDEQNGYDPTVSSANYAGVCYKTINYEAMQSKMEAVQAEIIHGLLMSMIGEALQDVTSTVISVIYDTQKSSVDIFTTKKYSEYMSYNIGKLDSSLSEYVNDITSYNQNVLQIKMASAKQLATTKVAGTTDKNNEQSLQKNTLVAKYQLGLQSNMAKVTADINHQISNVLTMKMATLATSNNPFDRARATIMKDIIYKSNTGGFVKSKDDVTGKVNFGQELVIGFTADLNDLKEREMAYQMVQAAARSVIVAAIKQSFNVNVSDANDAFMSVLDKFAQIGMTMVSLNFDSMYAKSQLDNAIIDAKKALKDAEDTYKTFMDNKAKREAGGIMGFISTAILAIAAVVAIAMTIVSGGALGGQAWALFSSASAWAAGFGLAGSALNHSVQMSQLQLQKNQLESQTQAFKIETLRQAFLKMLQEDGSLQNKVDLTNPNDPQAHTQRMAAAMKKMVSEMWQMVALLGGDGVIKDKGGGFKSADAAKMAQIRSQLMQMQNTMLALMMIEEAMADVHDITNQLLLGVSTKTKLMQAVQSAITSTFQLVNNAATFQQTQTYAKVQENNRVEQANKSLEQVNNAISTASNSFALSLIAQAVAAYIGGTAGTVVSVGVAVINYFQSQNSFNLANRQYQDYNKWQMDSLDPLLKEDKENDTKRLQEKLGNPVKKMRDKTADRLAQMENDIKREINKLSYSNATMDIGNGMKGMDPRVAVNTSKAIAQIMTQMMSMLTIAKSLEDVREFMISMMWGVNVGSGFSKLLQGAQNFQMAMTAALNLRMEQIKVDVQANNRIEKAKQDMEEAQRAKDNAGWDALFTIGIAVAKEVVSGWNKGADKLTSEQKMANLGIGLVQTSYQIMKISSDFAHEQDLANKGQEMGQLEKAQQQLMDMFDKLFKENEDDPLVKVILAGLKSMNTGLVEGSYGGKITLNSSYSSEISDAITQAFSLREAVIEALQARAEVLDEVRSMVFNSASMAENFQMATIANNIWQQAVGMMLNVATQNVQDYVTRYNAGVDARKKLEIATIQATLGKSYELLGGALNAVNSGNYGDTGKDINYKGLIDASIGFLKTMDMFTQTNKARDGVRDRETAKIGPRGSIKVSANRATGLKAQIAYMARATSDMGIYSEIQDLRTSEQAQNAQTWRDYEQQMMKIVASVLKEIFKLVDETKKIEMVKKVEEKNKAAQSIPHDNSESISIIPSTNSTSSNPISDSTLLKTLMKPESFATQSGSAAELLDPLNRNISASTSAGAPISLTESNSEKVPKVAGENNIGSPNDKPQIGEKNLADPTLLEKLVRGAGSLSAELDKETKRLKSHAGDTNFKAELYSRDAKASYASAVSGISFSNSDIAEGQNSWDAASSILEEANSLKADKIDQKTVATKTLEAAKKAQRDVAGYNFLETDSEEKTQQKINKIMADFGEFRPGYIDLGAIRSMKTDAVEFLASLLSKPSNPSDAVARQDASSQVPPHASAPVKVPQILAKQEENTKAKEQVTEEVVKEIRQDESQTSSTAPVTASTSQTVTTGVETNAGSSSVNAAQLHQAQSVGNTSNGVQVSKATNAYIGDEQVQNLKLAELQKQLKEIAAFLEKATSPFTQKEGAEGSKKMAGEVLQKVSAFVTVLNQSAASQSSEMQQIIQKLGALKSKDSLTLADLDPLMKEIKVAVEQLEKHLNIERLIIPELQKIMDLMDSINLTRKDGNIEKIINKKFHPDPEKDVTLKSDALIKLNKPKEVLSYFKANMTMTNKNIELAKQFMSSVSIAKETADLLPLMVDILKESDVKKEQKEKIIKDIFTIRGEPKGGELKATVSKNIAFLAQAVAGGLLPANGHEVKDILKDLKLILEKKGNEAVKNELAKSLLEMEEHLPPKTQAEINDLLKSLDIKQGVLSKPKLNLAQAKEILETLTSQVLSEEQKIKELLKGSPEHILEILQGNNKLINHNLGLIMKMSHGWNNADLGEFMKIIVDLKLNDKEKLKVQNTKLSRLTTFVKKEEKQGTKEMLKLLSSYHDFLKTPESKELLHKFAEYINEK